VTHHAAGPEQRHEERGEGADADERVSARSAHLLEEDDRAIGEAIRRRERALGALEPVPVALCSLDEVAGRGEQPLGAELLCVAPRLE
jgi:hypothetical protein